MLFHGRSVNSPLVAAVAHGPTVYNRQPGRIIWLESRGRNDQHQPAVPGPRYCRVQNMGGGRGDICPHPHTAAAWSPAHFLHEQPLFCGQIIRPPRDATLECGLNTHIIISLIIITITIVSQTSQITGVITGTDQGVLWVLYRSVADQILLWIWGWEVARV